MYSTTLLQSEAQALDDRISEPYGVREPGGISLSGCHLNRVQAISLGFSLGSTDSAADCSALFAGFSATMAKSDFPHPCIIGSGSSPSRCGFYAFSRSCLHWWSEKKARFSRSSND